jgi:radical SAM superfamily enzyme YgiQ (UPF0313 family)
MKALFVFRGGEWLGIEYLSSFLKSKGHEVDLIYHPGSGEVERRINFIEKLHNIIGIEDFMLKRAEKFEPDIIAFSSPTNLFPWVKKMAKKLKEALKVPVIVGGPHATSVPDYVLMQDGIDMVCIGEGEEAMLELVNSIEKGEKRTDIKNIWFKVDGKIIKNTVRPLIKDLDSLPFPDKEIFDQYGVINGRLYIMTARGCPYLCSYCYTTAWRNLYKNGGPFYRRRSVENVIEEIEYHLKRKNYEEIYFYDDIFTLNKAWLERFAEIYPSEIGIKFKALIHPEHIDEETVLLLKKAGCYYVDIGIESGSEKIRREVLNRKVSDKSIVRACEMFKNAGIKVCTLNIFGIPGETMDDMKKTVELNFRIKPDGAITSIMYPFPETEIYRHCLSKGLITEKEKEIVYEGYGSYKEPPLIKNGISPSIIYKYMRLLPFAVKLPAPLGRFLFKLPFPKFTDLIFLPFISIKRNFIIRLKELISGIIISWRKYLLER